MKDIVKEFMDVLNFRRGFDNSWNTQCKFMIEAVGGENPILKAKLEESMDELRMCFDMDGLLEEIGEVILKHYTEDELKEFITVYKANSIVRKVFERSVDIMNDSAEVGIKYGRMAEDRLARLLRTGDDFLN